MTDVPKDIMADRLLHTLEGLACLASVPPDLWDKHASYVQEAAALLRSLAERERRTPAVATHRHKKRGTEYVLIGVGKIQAETWYEAKNMNVRAVDMREVAIYRSVSDSSLWARPVAEFNDGRFEALPAYTASSAVKAEAVAWQAIDTADKDTDRMLLGIVRDGKLEEVHIGGYFYAENYDEVDCWWSDQADDEIVPTHWAPLFLPAAPSLSSGAGRSEERG